MEGKVIEMKRRHDLWFGIRMLIYGLIIGSISCHWWMYRYHAIDYGNGRAQGREEGRQTVYVSASATGCKSVPVGSSTQVICHGGLCPESMFVVGQDEYEKSKAEKFGPPQPKPHPKPVPTYPGGGANPK